MCSAGTVLLPPVSASAEPLGRWYAKAAFSQMVKAKQNPALAKCKFSCLDLGLCYQVQAPPEQVVFLWLCSEPSLCAAKGWVLWKGRQQPQRAERQRQLSADEETPSSTKAWRLRILWPV